MCSIGKAPGNLTKLFLRIQRQTPNRSILSRSTTTHCKAIFFDWLSMKVMVPCNLALQRYGKWRQELPFCLSLQPTHFLTKCFNLKHAEQILGMVLIKHWFLYINRLYYFCIFYTLGNCVNL